MNTDPVPEKDIFVHCIWPISSGTVDDDSAVPRDPSPPYNTYKYCQGVPRWRKPKQTRGELSKPSQTAIKVWKHIVRKQRTVRRSTKSFESETVLKFAPNDKVVFEGQHLILHSTDMLQITMVVVSTNIVDWTGLSWERFASNFRIFSLLL